MDFRKFLFVGTAAAILGMPIAMIGPALAQDSTESIRVVPPFSMQENATPLKGGMKTTTISFNRTVGYGDLDLSKPSDKAILAERIDVAAKNACRELDAKYPASVFVPTPETQDCVGNARGNALAMADIPSYGGVPE
jgi:UrcA family protein